MTNIETYLIVTPFFPSNKSFIGSYIYDQANEISCQSRYNVKVIKLTSLFSYDKDYNFGGLDVYSFKLIDFPFFIFPGLFNFINCWRFRSFLKRKKINNIKITHSHVAYPGAYLTSNLECKKIIQHHGLDVLQLKNGRSYICNRYIQRRTK